MPHHVTNVSPLPPTEEREPTIPEAQLDRREMIRKAAGTVGALALASCGQGTAPATEPVSPGRTLQAVTSDVTVLAMLRSIYAVLGDAAEVSGHTYPFDGGGGRFWYDPNCTAADDNAMIVASSNPQGRWRRSVADPLNVRWFGATGDGATDDTAAIAAAIVAVPATGGTVLFAPGQYVVATEITVPPNVHLSMSAGAVVAKSGAGALTIQGGLGAPRGQRIFLGFSPGEVVLAPSASASDVDPAWWGASPSASASANVQAIQCAISARKPVVLDRTLAIDASLDLPSATSIRFVGGAKLQNTTTDADFFTHASDGIDSDIGIYDGTFDGNPNGVNQQAVRFDGVSRARVFNCRMSNIANGIVFDNCVQLDIRQNTMEDCGSTAGGNGGSAIWVKGASSGIIADNALTRPRLEGIRLTDFTGTNDLVIRNNTIASAGDAGIDGAGSATSRVIIDGNNISSCGMLPASSSLLRCGINFHGVSRGVIVNNIVRRLQGPAFARSADLHGILDGRRLDRRGPICGPAKGGPRVHGGNRS